MERKNSWGKLLRERRLLEMSQHFRTKTLKASASQDRSLVVSLLHPTAAPSCISLTSTKPPLEEEEEEERQEGSGRPGGCCLPSQPHFHRSLGGGAHL